MRGSSSASVRERRALASLRRLCCLGLGGQIAIPALLAELHALLPSHINYFLWAGPNQKLANFYGEGDMMASLPLYLSEFHDKRVLEVAIPFSELMRTRRSVAANFQERTMKVDLRTFRRHGFYNEILRRDGLDKLLQLQVAEHGRGVGLLQVCRRDGEPEFTARDRKILEWIAPFIAHALAPGRIGEKLTESGDSGLIIVTPAGDIRYLSPQAERLLIMAQHPVLLSPGTPLPWAGAGLPPQVLQLCRDLVRIFEDKTPSAAPVCQIANAWGAFTFRAYWLDQTGGQTAPSQIGITTVQRLEPLALKLWRRAEELPLSGREIEVCLPLALGHSRGEIAERLGVSEHTAVTHCRNLFEKLGVHSRGELVEKLHAGA
jgi:DNA-binding CsgD family transcriptional regulator